MKRTNKHEFRVGDRVEYTYDKARATVKEVSTYAGGYIIVTLDNGEDAILHTLDAAEVLRPVKE